jgi:preprotein translocase subunit SecG
MLPFLTVLIAIVGVLLIVIVLIQNPKGGGVDSTFGTGANQMFGAAKQADLVEKLTWYFAGSLFVLCIVTAIYVSSNAGTTEGENIPLQTEETN